MKSIWAVVATTVLAAVAAGGEPTFKKVAVDKDFWSEGVAVGDINKDGKMDIFAGDVWYENLGVDPSTGSPKFARHVVREPRPSGHDLRKEKKDPKISPYDGGRGYSRSFACFAGDFDGDGYVDFICVNFPGEEFHWYENPKGKPGPWKEHKIWRSGCNETPWYGDLLGDGKPGLLLGIQPEGQIAYFRPGPDPREPWPFLAVSAKKSPGTERFSHGLGVGDVNKDGRRDVLITDGWWEQPAKQDDKPWTFHPNRLVPAKHTPPDPSRENNAMADLFAYDVNGDGKPDLIGSSAHKYGIWWFEQTTKPDGGVAFKPHVIREDISETHAMRFVDIDGDGKPDIVTGKRYYSHMRGEPGSGDAAVVIWIKIGSGKDGKPTFTSHVADSDSGVGTQFEVADFDGDGKPDIVTANKKGVHVLLQRGK